MQRFLEQLPPGARRLAETLIRLGAAIAAVMTIVSAWTVWQAGSRLASAAPTAQSPGATMTVSQGTSTFTTGNSGSVFSLRLPPNASCPFDSANSGWAWQTYMVPTTKDPSTLTFGSAGPSPASFSTYATFSEPLFTATGNAIKDQQTAAAETPPGPGQIVNLPDMGFGMVWTPGQVPAGTYNIGVACTKPGRIEDIFWNTTITITDDATNGGPGHFDIAYTPTSTPSTTTSSTIAGGTTTSTVGGTTTTGSGTTTSLSTPASGSSTVPAGGGTSDTTAAGTSPLATTGTNPLPLVVWALLLVWFGRMAMLVSRKTEIRTKGWG